MYMNRLTQESYIGLSLHSRDPEDGAGCFGQVELITGACTYSTCGNKFTGKMKSFWLGNLWEISCNLTNPNTTRFIKQGLLLLVHDRWISNDARPGAVASGSREEGLLSPPHPSPHRVSHQARGRAAGDG